MVSIKGKQKNTKPIEKVRKIKPIKLRLPTIYCSAISRNSTFFILDDAYVLDGGFRPRELADILHEKKETGEFAYPQLIKESTQRRGVFFAQAKSQKTATAFLQNVRIPSPTTITNEETIYEFDNKIIVKFKNNTNIQHLFERINIFLASMQNPELLKKWKIESDKYLKIPTEERDDDEQKEVFTGIALLHENYQLAFAPLFYPLFICSKTPIENLQ